MLACSGKFKARFIIDPPEIAMDTTQIENILWPVKTSNKQNKLIDVEVAKIEYV